MMTDDKYIETLKRMFYTEEQIESIISFRSQNDHCTFEQFDYLFRTGIVTRTRKLRKPRNLYVKDDKFYYLDHYQKDWRYCGEFKS